MVRLGEVEYGWVRLVDDRIGHRKIAIQVPIVALLVATASESQRMHCFFGEVKYAATCKIECFTENEHAEVI